MLVNNCTGALKTICTYLNKKSDTVNISNLADDLNEFTINNCYLYYSFDDKYITSLSTFHQGTHKTYSLIEACQICRNLGNGTLPSLSFIGIATNMKQTAFNFFNGKKRIRG